jgi:hypothetical protein
VLDLTDRHPELSSSPPAVEAPVEASVETQRRRLLMLVRGAAFQMEKHLSRSGGGMPGVLVKQLAQQGVNRAASQLVRNSDAQTQALTRFLRQIMRAVCASDCSDEQFVAEFEDAWAAVSAAFEDRAASEQDSEQQ